ncbi:MAG: Ig-like domain-containing protein [Bacteroidales bacterium]|jgi:calcineurin-like phosphoesterase family protein|nr:Ig-like domain-containing protein [Bacteroidales bacterium]
MKNLLLFSFFLRFTIFTICVFLFSTCQKPNPEAIFVSNLILNKNELILEIGEKETLIATLYPDNVINKRVIWTSSDTLTATVNDEGLVTAINKGNAIITVTTEEGEKSDTCSVVVSLKRLRIVHWSDPQLGWGYVKDETAIRAVQLINEINPDIVMLAGDMIHTYDKIDDFLKIVANVKVPILFTPGNHDLSDSVTTEVLQRYRSFFGDDFITMEIKDFFIISANSSLLLYPDDVPKEEYNQHYARVNEALKYAQSKNMPVITMTHIAPFQQPDILKLFVENGTFLWISGHWHIPYQQSLVFPYGTINILVGESSGWNDNYPLGVRLLTIYSDKSFDWVSIPLYQQGQYQLPIIK